MKNFYQVMEELMEFEGFELLFGGEGKLVGKKGEEIRSLVIAGEKVGETDLKDIRDSEGERILVVLSELSDEVRDGLDEDVVVWDRAVLVDKIGEMMLETSIFEGATEGKSLKGSEVDFEIEHKRKESILKPVMDFDDVTELGDKIVKGFKYRLELVPLYLFSFEVDGGEGVKGRLYFNAISGHEQFWDQEFERVGEVKRSHFKLEPNIPKERVKVRAVEAIKEKYSKVDPDRWEEDGAVIVEKKKYVPDEGDITINDRGIVYVPMWAVEGTDGVLIVNAATGKIESEPDKFMDNATYTVEKNKGV